MIANQAIPDDRGARTRGDRVGRGPLETRFSPVKIQGVDKRGTRYGYGVATTHAGTVTAHRQHASELQVLPVLGRHVID